MFFSTIGNAQTMKVLVIFHDFWYWLEKKTTCNFLWSLMMAKLKKVFVNFFWFGNAYIIKVLLIFQVTFNDGYKKNVLVILLTFNNAQILKVLVFFMNFNNGKVGIWWLHDYIAYCSVITNKIIAQVTHFTMGFNKRL